MIDLLKQMVELPYESLSISKVTESNELYGYLVNLIGGDLTTEDENCLYDISYAAIAQCEGLIPLNSTVVVTSDKLLKRSEFFRKSFNVKIIPLSEFLEINVVDSEFSTE